MNRSSRPSHSTPRQPAALPLETGSTSNWMAQALRIIFDGLFACDQRAAHRRLLIFLLSALFLWFTLAIFLVLQRPASASLLKDLLNALFSFQILRHLLVIGLAFWLALLITAVYLDDVFELKNLPIAQRFILGAAFALFYGRISIRNGAVSPRHLDSPIVQIGGPGVVDVHLENAALFERVDGSPRIVAPTSDRSLILDGFERLRQVVDLRDQVVEMTVSGRTQDGIPITAKDVRLVFSIYRGGKRSDPNEVFVQPYPFSEQAVMDLVYKKESGPWVEGLRGMIRRELVHFIAQHTLSEFLTTANTEVQASSLVPREELSDLFFDFTSGFSERARERGVELGWIGVGTWVLPSQIIPERHMEAWRLSYESRARKSPQSLLKLRQETRVVELLRLIDEVLTIYYSLLDQEMPADLIMQTMVHLYQEKIRSALDLQVSQQQPAATDLQTAFDHLEQLFNPQNGELDI